MLTEIQITDVVLIKSLTLRPGTGLVVLTGETGAGKSVLLDSLGLVLGARSDFTLIRQGAHRASVVAVFELPASERMQTLLNELGIFVEEDHLFFKRVLERSGRSRAWVNDQAVTLKGLQALAAELIEIQGQFEQHGLLDPLRHREVLDHYGAVSMAAVQKAWQAWAEARAQLAQKKKDCEQLSAKAEELTRIRQELETLGTRPGELEELTHKHQLLAQAARLAAVLQEMRENLDQVTDPVGRALATLQRQETLLGTPGQQALKALSRANIEIEEARAQMETLAETLEYDPAAGDALQERLVAYRELARKLHVPPEKLLEAQETILSQLDEADKAQSALQEFAEDVETKKQTYEQAADTLSNLRQEAARKLDAFVNEELPQLHMPAAQFSTQITPKPPEAWNENGKDAVQFFARTLENGQAMPLHKVASGGELSRFLLAIKVGLGDKSSHTAFVFDELDAGLSGASAAAIGERLMKLAQQRQILVITHSPQVASCGSRHFVVERRQVPEGSETYVREIADQERTSEIARLLSASQITSEALAAAESLLERSQKHR